MSSKKDKLAALKRARAGESILAVYEDVKYDSIYEELDEETYRKRKRDQLLKEDFVVGDVNNDYLDDGTGNEVSNNGHSDEDDLENEEEVSEKKTKAINKFFQPSVSKIVKKSSKKKTVDVNDILEDFDLDLPKKTKKFKISKGPNDDLLEFGGVLKRSKIKQEPVQEPEILSEQVVVEEVDKENVKIEEDIKLQLEDDDEEIIVTRRPTRQLNNFTRNVNMLAVKRSSSPPAALLQDSPPAKFSPAAVTQSKETVSAADVLQTDGKFRMYWMDYAETDTSLLLFGKIKTNSGQYVSNILQINGIERELFLLPRAVSRSEGTPVTTDDVYEEIIPNLLDKYGLESIKAKPEVKKYAFELPEVPKEAEYLKILMPYQTPKCQSLNLPLDIEGDTFSKLFGASTDIFESFVVQKNVMGPCWLEIEQGDFTSLSSTSHCQLEVALSSPKHVKVVDSSEFPLTTVLGLHVMPIYNEKTNKQEVAGVSLAVYRSVAVDTLSPDTVADETFNLIRPVGILKTSFPPGLAKKALELKLNISTFPTERTLLSYLCALVKRHDPDFFLGHNLESSSLDILIHRMHELKVPTWSFFGRRNRKQWPDRLTRGAKYASSSFMNNVRIKEIFQGRLVCDISNELGKSITLKCQNWDLSEMYNLVCQKQFYNVDLNLNQSQYSEDSDALLSALKNLAARCAIASEIGYALQIVSLSRTLTNIVGNSWSKTLGGTRTDRSEFLLLHEFKRNNYILPDKDTQYGKKEETSKKAQYKGGLVLEPEVGLHKLFVVVMDFNSLYPSIIQEFNICFTTIDRDAFNKTSSEDDLPSYPGPEVKQGILPRVLSSLVGRRKEVKKLLKQKNISAAEKNTYDIKQLALKLQANSLYGYLGYEKGRFYAKALAMLTTAKGREILMDTKKLAESIDLHTIYGDTDSLMIETRATVYDETIESARRFQEVVNSKHTVLELGLDNVFKGILLHLKKKYAAFNVVKEGDTLKLNLEVKGLDLRRREYSPLTKDTSNFILNKILSDEDAESVLNEIYGYLEDLTVKIKANEIPLEQFRINTKLSKDPASYPGGKSMPQVQVALRLRKQGKIVRAGSVITYIITEAEEGTPAERARSLQEVLVKNASFRPDPKYYLEKQLFNPLERLLQTYPGIDLVRLAESLGLEGRRYERREVTGNQAGFVPLEATISHEEKYRYCEYLGLECSCGVKFSFGGIVASDKYKVTGGGVYCLSCRTTMGTLRLTSQLERQVRTYISVYYSSWLVCDDASCGTVTRQIGVYGRRCLNEDCKGLMKFKYSDQELYRQLMYFHSMFDVEVNKLQSLKSQATEKLPQHQVTVLAEQNRELFELCQSVLDKYLNNSARRFVDMGSIFGFM